MDQLKKRDRGSNFQKSEVILLTELVSKYRSIIENKKTDAATNRNKDAAWKKIASTFNAVSNGIFRSAKTLKMKYESMKKIVKKKIACQRQEFYKTGGEPSNASDLNEVEEKLLEFKSDIISGMDSRRDSDNIADSTNKWEMWNQKSLNQKSEKLDDLSSARLELVQLQQRIAETEHLFKKEEHELKMSNLRNEENRRAELHQLQLMLMQSTG